MVLSMLADSSKSSSASLAAAPTAFHHRTLCTRSSCPLRTASNCPHTCYCQSSKQLLLGVLHPQTLPCLPRVLPASPVLI